VVGSELATLTVPTTSGASEMAFVCADKHLRAKRAGAVPRIQCTDSPCDPRAASRVLERFDSLVISFFGVDSLVFQTLLAVSYTTVGDMHGVLGFPIDAARYQHSRLPSALLVLTFWGVFYG
jgi:hypothetical protein